MTNADRIGRLDRSGDAPQLQFVRRLDHAPQAVWQALTEADDLAAWFPATIDGQWKTGAALRFTFPDDEGPPMGGEVITYEPHRLLEYSWGEDRFRFELVPDGEHTVLHLTVTLGELGKAARDAAGWHECLDRLEHRLAGQPPGFEANERWAEVHPDYVNQFGPHAATIGPPESHPVSDVDGHEAHD